jgi:hypothetical protein
MRYFVSSFLFFVFNCLILSNITIAQSRSGSSIEDFTITITFVQNPVNGPTVFKAPLKYNKDFALILQMDNGNTAIHDQVMPYFKGQNGNPGLFLLKGPMEATSLSKWMLPILLLMRPDRMFTIMLMAICTGTI